MRFVASRLNSHSSHYAFKLNMHLDPLTPLFVWLAAENSIDIIWYYQIWLDRTKNIIPKNINVPFEQKPNETVWFSFATNFRRIYSMSMAWQCAEDGCEWGKALQIESPVRMDVENELVSSECCNLFAFDISHSTNNIVLWRKRHSWNYFHERTPICSYITSQFPNWKTKWFRNGWHFIESKTWFFFFRISSNECLRFALLSHNISILLSPFDPAKYIDHYLHQGNV